MLPYEYELDISRDVVGDEDYVAAVNAHVVRMIARGFDAEVVTYCGPSNGAPVLRFGPGVRDFGELDRFMSETYEPDWFDIQIETR